MKAAVKSRRAAFADGTFSNLRTQWKSYVDFCREYDVPTLPIRAKVLSVYLEHLAGRLKSPGAIASYMAGLKTLSILIEAPVDVFSHIHVKLGLKGIRRLKLHTPKQAKALSPAIMLAMQKLVDTSKPRELAAWAAISLGFACFMRKSNLVPNAASSFDPKRQLCRSDVQVAEHHSCLTVRVKWSKTNNFASRQILVPVMALPGHPLCPVRAYLDALQAVPLDNIRPSDVSAFSIPPIRRTAKHAALSYPMLTVYLKRWLSLAGYDESLFSTHSIRRGGATAAFDAEVPGELIQLVGDWSSPVYQRYLEISTQRKLAVAGKLKRHFLKLAGVVE